MRDLLPVEGAVRSVASQERRIYNLWACKLHQRCFTADHVDLDELRRQAKNCLPKCKCWRHSVIKVAEARGEG